MTGIGEVDISIPILLPNPRTNLTAQFHSSYKRQAPENVDAHDIVTEGRDDFHTPSEYISPPASRSNRIASSKPQTPKRSLSDGSPPPS